jgi:hypothetical protein
MIENSYSPCFYPLRYYDNYFRLKIPLRLWFIIAYSAFHPLMSGGITVYIDHFVFERANINFFLFIPSLIAVPVVLAALLRQSSPTLWKKSLWQKSYFILLVSNGISFLFLFFLNGDFFTDRFDDRLFYNLFFVFLSFFIFVYLLFSRFIKDVFADFPEMRWRVINTVL